MSIPQIAMTPEFELKLAFDYPSSCFFVIVGGKYLNKIGSVMEKIDSITNDIGGTRPLAVFIISNTNKDDIDYSFDRIKSTPVMVKLKSFEMIPNMKFKGTSRQKQI